MLKHDTCIIILIMHQFPTAKNLYELYSNKILDNSSKTFLQKVCVWIFKTKIIQQ